MTKLTIKLQALVKTPTRKRSKSVNNQHSNGNNVPVHSPSPIREHRSDIPFRHLDLAVPYSDNLRVSERDFEILGFLGQGGFGKVYLAKVRDADRYFAMKVVPKSKARDAEDINALFVERNALIRCQHPFIVRLHHTFQSKANIYFIMQYMPGGDLASLLSKSPNNRLCMETARLYAAELALALEYLHSSCIIFRDLKPNNVLLDLQGHVYLTDFGLAKLNATKATDIVGSPFYIAPEILLQKPYGKAVDWWSWGVLLFNMLNGKVPFHGHNVREIFDRVLHAHPPYHSYHDLSSEAIDLLSRALSKNEVYRVQSLASVKAFAFFSGMDWESVLNKKILPPNFQAASPSVSIQTSPSSTQPRRPSDSGIFDNIEGFTLQYNEMDEFMLWLNNVRQIRAHRRMIFELESMICDVGWARDGVITDLMIQEQWSMCYQEFRILYSNTEKLSMIIGDTFRHRDHLISQFVVDCSDRSTLAENIRMASKLKYLDWLTKMNSITTQLTKKMMALGDYLVALTMEMIELLTEVELFNMRNNAVCHRISESIRKGIEEAMPGSNCELNKFNEEWINASRQRAILNNQECIELQHKLEKQGEQIQIGMDHGWNHRRLILNELRGQDDAESYRPPVHIKTVSPHSAPKDGVSYERETCSSPINMDN